METKNERVQRWLLAFAFAMVASRSVAAAAQVSLFKPTLDWFQLNITDIINHPALPLSCVLVIILSMIGWAISKRAECWVGVALGAAGALAWTTRWEIISGFGITVQGGP